MKILESLRKIAFEKAENYPTDLFRIRGLWNLEYMSQPYINERIFHYNVFFAECPGVGACHTEEANLPNKSLIGTDARKIPASLSRPVEIAILDGIYSIFDKKPTYSEFVRGTSEQRASRRSEIVLSEVINLLDFNSNRKPKIVNIGTVGAFIKRLRKLDVEIFATDRDPNLRSVEGINIQKGDQSISLVKECDLALMSGMVLSTDTIDELLYAAKINNKKVVMFNETGSHFSEEYCRMGVDSAISEPFPFYLYSECKIDVYRKANTK